MIRKFITVLLTKSISPNFYPGQILSAVRSKICPLRPNSTQEETRLCFSLHIFRALQQPLPACFTTKKSIVKASLFAKYHSISISVLLKD